MESISEAKVSTLHFFDIDETVFNTFAKIIVRDKDTGDEITQLTNQQFNSYKLKDNEEFDFSQFGDAALFTGTSKVIKPTLNMVKRAYADKNSIVFFLTARADFDSNSTFKSAFRAVGLRVNDKRIRFELAGNLQKGTIPQKKEYIIRRQLNRFNPSEVIIYDDHLENVKIADSIAKDFPRTRFRKILITNGRAKNIGTVNDMKAFKEHVLMEDSFRDLDQEFIARATKISSFNIKAADLEKLTHKKEIQFLYSTYLFKGFDLNLLTNGLNVSKANAAIAKLKQLNNSGFKSLYDFQPKGVGPGEALLYFLVNDARLGGGGSAGVDVIIGSKKYEVKAANLSKDKKSVTGFRLGGTVDVSTEVRAAVKLKEQLGFTTKGKGKAEVNRTQIRAIQAEYPAEWNKISQSYIDKAYKYLAANPVIFFNNNKSAAIGQIIAETNVKRQDIQISEITQGGIKPRVLV